MVVNRLTQDRRENARVPSRLQCQYTYEGTRCDTVIVNLSLNGAYLTAKIPPPIGKIISLTIQTPTLKNTLTLEAKVVRHGWGVIDYGDINRFGIRFSRSASELIGLINKLTLDQKSKPLR